MFRGTLSRRFAATVLLRQQQQQQQHHRSAVASTSSGGVATGTTAATISAPGLGLTTLYQALERSEKHIMSQQQQQQQHNQAAPPRPINIVEISNKTANDILHAIANDLRNLEPAASTSHHHHQQQQQQQRTHQHNATARVSAATVCKMIRKICEESNVHHNALEAALNQNNNTSSNKSNEEQQQLRYSIQKNTLVSLILALARLPEMNNSSATGGASTNNTNDSFTPADAERAVAALCEMALPHTPSISAPEWFGIVSSFAKLRILSSSSSPRKAATADIAQAAEVQRACAFMVHMALEKLLFSSSSSSCELSTDAPDSMFLMRVRDALSFSNSLAKLLPRASAVLPIPPPASSAKFGPTWQQATAQLLRRMAQVSEICTTDQACLMLQNGCQLVSALAQQHQRGEKLATQLDSDLIFAFSLLVERTVERVSATLVSVYEVQQQELQEQHSPVSTSPEAILYASKLNVTAVLDSAPQLTGSVNQLFSSLVPLIRVLREVSTASNYMNSNNTLVDNAARLMKLCLFAAECGPQLLQASLARQVQQQQQEQQGTKKNAAHNSDESIVATGGGTIGATFSNVLGQVMHIENNHVLVKKTIGSSSSSQTDKNTVFAQLEQRGLIQLLEQSHAQYIAACSTDALAHFSAQGVSQIANLLHILQCLSNRLVSESRPYLLDQQQREEQIQLKQQQEQKDTSSSKNNNNEDDDEDYVLIAGATVATVSATSIIDESAAALGVSEDIVARAQPKEQQQQKQQQEHRMIIGGIAITAPSVTALTPIVLQILMELELRANADRNARLQLFSAAKSAFGTARRITPLLSTVMLEPLLSDDKNKDAIARLVSLVPREMLQRRDEPQQQQSQQQEQRERAVALGIAFKGLLRVIKAGFAQRPRPNLGPTVAVANYIADEAPRVFALLTPTVVPTPVRDGALLDAATVLLDKCRALVPPPPSSGNNKHNKTRRQQQEQQLQLDEMLGLASAISRLHRCVTTLQEKELGNSRNSGSEDDAENNKDAEDDDDDDSKTASSSGTVAAQQKLQQQMQAQTLQLACSRLVAAADALCDDNCGALRLVIENKLAEDDEQQQEQLKQGDDAGNEGEEEEAVPTKMLLSFVQRLAPLSQSVDSATHQLLSFILLTVLPDRASSSTSGNHRSLSPLEATLTLTAMQASKLWRQNVVVRLMDIVRQAHSSQPQSQQQQQQQHVQQSHSIAAKEISVALVAMCQLSAGIGATADATSSAAAAATSSRQEQEQQRQELATGAGSPKGIIEGLVKSLVELPAEHVPVRSLLSVWRKLISAAHSSTSVATFSSLLQLIAAVKRSGVLPTTGDVLTCIAAAERTLTHFALDPTAGGRKSRHELSIAVGDLVGQVLSRHVFVESVITGAATVDSAATSTFLCDDGEGAAPCATISPTDISAARQILRLQETLRNWRIAVPLSQEASLQGSRFVEAATMHWWASRVAPLLLRVFVSSGEKSNSNSSGNSLLAKRMAGVPDTTESSTLLASLDTFTPPPQEAAALLKQIADTNNAAETEVIIESSDSAHQSPLLSASADKQLAYVELIAALLRIAHSLLSQQQQQQQHEIDKLAIEVIEHLADEVLSTRRNHSNTKLRRALSLVALEMLAQQQQQPNEDDISTTKVQRWRPQLLRLSLDLTPVSSSVMVLGQRLSQQSTTGGTGRVPRAAVLGARVLSQMGGGDNNLKQSGSDSDLNEAEAKFAQRWGSYVKRSLLLRPGEHDTEQQEALRREFVVSK